jgi:hypothetical protein
LENDGVVDEHLDSTYTAYMDIMASPESDASNLRVVAVGVQGLVDSAVDGFVLLEPWCLTEFVYSHSIYSSTEIYHC